MAQAITWICSRDLKKVAAIGKFSPADGLRLAMVRYAPKFEILRREGGEGAALFDKAVAEGIWSDQAVEQVVLRARAGEVRVRARRTA